MRLFTLIGLMTFSLLSQAQKVNGKITFQPGQVLNINTKTTTVNLVSAMGQEIEIKTEGIVDHQYKVTNTTEENHTLSHEIKCIRVNTEGMGNNMSINSDSEKDMKGQFAAPVKEMLEQKHSLVIDETGNTILSMKNGKDSSKTLPARGVMAQFTGGLSSLIDPPKSGEASFFKVLPATPVSKGDAWTSTVERDGTKTEEVYSVAEITNDLILLNYQSNSTTNSVQQNMGIEFTLNLKNKTEGKISIDRKTGIVKQKNTTTNSTGTTSNPSYGEFPINSTTYTYITVN